MKIRIPGWRLPWTAWMMAVCVAAQAAPPTVVRIDPAPGRVTTLNEITLTFDRPVSGVDPGDLLMNGRRAREVTGSGQTWRFAFDPPAAGTVLASVAADHAIASITTPPELLAGTPLQWVFELLDRTAPVIAEAHPPPGLTLRRLSQVEIFFSEPVQGVKAGDLLINGQPCRTVTGLSAGPYRFSFEPVESGSASLSWSPAHQIRDLAAPANALNPSGWTYAVNPGQPRADVIISEIQAANLTGLKDETGQAQDWIELWNRGGQAVNLAGWSLTDDPGAEDNWIFPDVSLGAGARLIVFASGAMTTNAAPAGPLHASFRLSRAGEYLALLDPELPRNVVSEISPSFPEQRNDISYGLDAEGRWRYFRSPTPGGPNGSSTLTGVTEKPRFSVERGFFNNVFFLTLSSGTPRAVIRYTTDGSEPTESRGTVYSNPLFINSSTILRAAAFQSGLLPSDVVTHTYLFNPSPATTSLPVLSLVTDTNNLFGPTGIMEINPRNTTKHGIAWERPVSAELLHVDGRDGFQVDCGLRVLGGDVVRESYNYNAGPPFGKYSFGLYFRSDYGPGTLNYPLFEEAGALLDSFDRIGLRAGFNDPLNPFVDDELVRRLMSDTGQVAAHGTFVNLFINGAYKGYYNPVERITPRFLQSWHGGSEDWDIIEQYEVARDGSIDEWKTLRDFVAATDFSIPSNYQEISRRMDVTNFVDYLLVNIYAATGDWPFNNWRAARERVPGARWRFYSWDAEWSFGYIRNKVDHDSIVNEVSLNFTPIGNFFLQLKRSPEFRLLFADRVQKHFAPGGALSETNVLRRFEELRQTMAGVIPAMSQTVPTIWVPERKGYAFQHMNAAGLLQPIAAPVFSTAGGRVPRGHSITASAPDGTIFYTTNGLDPRVAFSGAVAPEALPWPAGTALRLDRSVVIKARVRLGQEWSALNEAPFEVAQIGLPVRITEIMYNPDGDDTTEFLELQALGGTAVDLSGAQFNGIDFQFPKGFLVHPGVPVVLVSNTDPAAFAARYPGVQVSGYFQGALSNGGERISLQGPDGGLIDLVSYDDEGGWPTEPDGDGYSLELADLEGSGSDPGSWLPSARPGGTPGQASLPEASPIRLNEVMALNASTVSNGGTFSGWVELHNGSSQSVSLEGWSLSNDDDPGKFRFSGGTEIPPGGYLVVWCDSLFDAPGQHTGFTITEPGTSLFLHDSNRHRVDAVTLGTQMHERSVGRVHGTWVLTFPTPGAANSIATVAPASEMMINEWLANALPGASDWIEIFNRSAIFPIAVRGLGFQVDGVTARIESLSFIPPRGHLQILADERPGLNHVSVKLPAVGARLELRAPGGEVADQIQYAAQAEGISEGRLPDGATTVTRFPDSPSPGASNYLVTYTGVRLSEVMARNVDAVPDAAGRRPDWIEIANPSGFNFDLTGMRLSTAGADDGEWIFPPESSVPGNGFLVVWFDPNRPASTAAEAQMNTGLRIDGDGGAIRLANRAGQVVDTVEFGPQLVNRSIGLVGDAWKLLASPTPGLPNSAPAGLGSESQLRINEWLARPLFGDDWIEIHNPGSLPVSLTQLRLTDDPSIAGQARFVFGPLSFIGANGWVAVQADGSPDLGPTHADFGLDYRGESILLLDTAGRRIDSVHFELQTAGVSEGRWPDGSLTLERFRSTASPGESNFLPLTEVAISEVMANPSSPLEGAIEIQNLTDRPVNIGGWFLSDDGANLRKYQFPFGTLLEPRGFRVVYEGSYGTGPTAFHLPTGRAGEVHLAAVDAAGHLTGRQSVSHFRGMESGTSYGRVQTVSGSDFFPVTTRTFGRDNPISVSEFRLGAGLPNAGPRIGPVIITEILHEPAPSNTPGVEAGDDQFIELRNVTASQVLLFDPANPASRWRIAGGDVSFALPTAVILPAQAYLLLVNFDPADPAALARFRTRYNVPGSTLILGPMPGKLRSDVSTIELLRPGIPAATGPDAGIVPGHLVDRVAYENRSPWPMVASNGGKSIQRQFLERFGNDPANWRALEPTPGRDNAISLVTDADNDGLPDDWERSHGLNPNLAADAGQDSDGDGFTNSQEYLAGTDPRDPASRLHLVASVANGGGIVLEFIASPGRRYVVEFTDALKPTSDWRRLAEFEPESQPRNIVLQDNGTGSGRFYRIGVEATP